VDAAGRVDAQYQGQINKSPALYPVSDCISMCIRTLYSRVSQQGLSLSLSLWVLWYVPYIIPWSRKKERKRNSAGLSVDAGATVFCVYVTVVRISYICDQKTKGKVATERDRPSLTNTIYGGETSNHLWYSPYQMTKARIDRDSYLYYRS
jgi:hypothetical protein